MRGRIAILVVAVGLGASRRSEAAPLAGRWEGTFHGGRGDRHVLLVCRPRGADSLAGALYMDGDEVGPLEGGRVRGDSLSFRVMNFLLHAVRSNHGMAVRLEVPHGATHEFDVRFVSADTT